MIFHKLSSAFRELLFPDACRCCGRKLVAEERFLCDDCLPALPLTMQCDAPAEPNFMRAKFSGLKLEKCCCYYEYDKDSPFAEIIREIKFGHDTALGRFMGRRFGLLLDSSDEFGDIDCLVPVPLHWTRRHRRGYNQAEIIAEGIAEQLPVPVCPAAVRRIRRTSPQTSLSGTARRKHNLAGAFRVCAPELLRGKHILIVDDVATTGSTIRELAREIRRTCPDTRISVATLAATPFLK